MYGPQGYEGLENKVWFQAKADRIEHFYKTVLPLTAYGQEYRF
jgi:hypothetical protein